MRRRYPYAYIGQVTPQNLLGKLATYFSISTNFWIKVAECINWNTHTLTGWGLCFTSISTLHFPRSAQLTLYAPFPGIIISIIILYCISLPEAHWHRDKIIFMGEMYCSWRGEDNYNIHNQICNLTLCPSVSKFYFNTDHCFLRATECSNRKRRLTPLLSVNQHLNSQTDLHKSLQQDGSFYGVWFVKELYIKASIKWVLKQLEGRL